MTKAQKLNIAMIKFSTEMLKLSRATLDAGLAMRRLGAVVSQTDIKEDAGPGATQPTIEELK